MCTVIALALLSAGLQNGVAASEPPVPAQPLRASFTDVLHQRDAAGTLWTRGEDWRASFDGAGATILPVFGTDAPDESPLRLELEGITVGGSDLPVHAAETAAWEAGTVVLDRGNVRELFRTELGSVEHLVELGNLEGDGELVVRFGVETEMAALAQGRDLAFVRSGLGSVEIGDAFLIDGRGDRTLIDRVWTGDAIEWRVPAHVMASAARPLTIDPIISVFQNGYGTPDDLEPDVCYAGVDNKWWLVWEDETSQTNRDVYLSRFSSLGAQEITFAIDLTSNYFEQPAVAYCYAQDSLMVAALESANGTSTEARGVTYTVLQAFDGVAILPNTPLDDPGMRANSADVGGSRSFEPGEAAFCIVHDEDNAFLSGGLSTISDVVYSVLDGVGNEIRSSYVVFAFGSFQFWLEPRISQSMGDSDEPGGAFWTCTYLHNGDGSSRGDVWASTIPFDGDPLELEHVLLNDSGQCGNADVTSQLDDALPAPFDARPIVVVYDEFNGSDMDVLVHPLVPGFAFAPVLLAELEDFDASLNQSAPAVSSDGDNIFIAYLEEPWAGGGLSDADVHYASGQLTFDGLGAGFALSERHTALTSGGIHAYLTNASIADGEISGTSDSALVGFVDLTGTNGIGGQIELARIRSSLVAGFGDGVIGTQYCEAQTHSQSTAGGRRNAWLWIRENTYGPGADATLYGHDLPVGTPALVITSRQAGFTANPGGSAGNLCLGGSIGRFNNQIQFAGTNGRISMDFDWDALPNGTATVAAQPGDTWHFQVWFRDGGTSNFSNGVRVEYQP